MSEISRELADGNLSDEQQHGVEDGCIPTDANTVGCEPSHTPVERKPRTRRRRFRINWMLVTLFVSLFVAYFFYVVALPEIETILFQMANPKKKILPPELEMKWANRILLRTCEFLFVCWFFYFGASIGSFLNVVAWRVPLGRTIVFGGSKCPFCDTRLSFIDNTPILGWLYLQGRCRTCRLPIAPRYLLIEIAVGVVFMWLALWQLVRGGGNLPGWRFAGRNGLVNIVLDPQWPLIGLYLLHVVMFGILIMLATANSGKRPFPIFPLALIGFGLASTKIVNPSLDLVAWYLPFSKAGFPNGGPFANPALSVLIGGIAGGVLGWSSSFVFKRQFGAIVVRHWTLQCFLIGVVLGWQSVLTIVMVTLVVYGVVRTIYRMLQPEPSNWTLSNQSLGLNACFITVALVHHSFWNQIAHQIGLLLAI